MIDLLKRVFFDYLFLFKNFFHWNISKILIIIVSVFIGIIISLPFTLYIGYMSYFSYDKVKDYLGNNFSNVGEKQNFIKPNKAIFDSINEVNKKFEDKEFYVDYPKNYIEIFDQFSLLFNNKTGLHLDEDIKNKVLNEIIPNTEKKGFYFDQKGIAEFENEFLNVLELKFPPDNYLVSLFKSFSSKFQYEKLPKLINNLKDDFLQTSSFKFYFHIILLIISIILIPLLIYFGYYYSSFLLTYLYLNYLDRKKIDYKNNHYFDFTLFFKYFKVASMIIIIYFIVFILFLIFSFLLYKNIIGTFPHIDWSLNNIEKNITDLLNINAVKNYLLAQFLFLLLFLIICFYLNYRLGFSFIMIFKNSNNNNFTSRDSLKKSLEITKGYKGFIIFLFLYILLLTLFLYVEDIISLIAYFLKIPNIIVIFLYFIILFGIFDMLYVTYYKNYLSSNEKKSKNKLKSPIKKIGFNIKKI